MCSTVSTVTMSGMVSKGRGGGAFRPYQSRTSLPPGSVSSNCYEPPRYELNSSFYHHTQSNAKMYEMMFRLKMVAYEQLRRSGAAVLHEKEEDDKIKFLERYPLSTDVTLTIEVPREDHADIIANVDSWCKRDSIANIMSETGVLVVFPSGRADLDASSQATSTVRLKGPVAKVEEARHRLRELCPVSISIPLLEMKGNMLVEEAKQLIGKAISEKQIDFPFVDITVVRRRTEIVDGEVQVPVGHQWEVVVRGAWCREDDVHDACVALRQLLFDPNDRKEKDASSFYASQVDVPASHQLAVMGLADAFLVRLVSNQTGALVCYPNPGRKDGNGSPVTMLYLRGPVRSILKAHKYFQGLLPAELSFDVEDEDLVQRVDRRHRTFTRRDDILGVNISVEASRIEGEQLAAHDFMRHLVSIDSGEFNLSNTFATRRALIRADVLDEAAVLCNDYNFFDQFVKQCVVDNATILFREMPQMKEIGQASWLPSMLCLSMQGTSVAPCTLSWSGAGRATAIPVQPFNSPVPMGKPTLCRSSTNSTSEICPLHVQGVTESSTRSGQGSRTTSVSSSTHSVASPSILPSSSSSSNTLLMPHPNGLPAQLVTVPPPTPTFNQPSNFANTQPSSVANTRNEGLPHPVVDNSETFREQNNKDAFKHAQGPRPNPLSQPIASFIRQTMPPPIIDMVAGGCVRATNDKRNEEGTRTKPPSMPEERIGSAISLSSLDSGHRAIASVVPSLSNSPSNTRPNSRASDRYTRMPLTDLGNDKRNATKRFADMRVYGDRRTHAKTLALKPNFFCEHFLTSGNPPKEEDTSGDVQSKVNGDMSSDVRLSPRGGGASSRSCIGDTRAPLNNHSAALRLQERRFSPRGSREGLSRDLSNRNALDREPRRDLRECRNDSQDLTREPPSMRAHQNQMYNADTRRPFRNPPMEYRDPRRDLNDTLGHFDRQLFNEYRGDFRGRQFGRQPAVFLNERDNAMGWNRSPLQRFMPPLFDPFPSRRDNYSRPPRMPMSRGATRGVRDGLSRGSNQRYSIPLTSPYCAFEDGGAAGPSHTPTYTNQRTVPHSLPPTINPDKTVNAAPKDASAHNQSKDHSPLQKQAEHINEPQGKLECASECANEKVVKKECANEKVVKKECVNAKVATKECANEKVVTKECANEKVVMKECANEKVVKKECANEKVVKKECANEKVVKKECANEKVVKKECANEKVVTKEQPSLAVKSEADCAEKTRRTSSSTSSTYAEVAGHGGAVQIEKCTREKKSKRTNKAVSRPTECIDNSDDSAECSKSYAEMTKKSVERNSSLSSPVSRQSEFPDTPNSKSSKSSVGSERGSLKGKVDWTLANFDTIPKVLSQIECEHLLSVFKTHNLKMSDLVTMSEEDLVKVGIESASDRTRINRAILRLRFAQHK